MKRRRDTTGAVPRRRLRAKLAAALACLALLPAADGLAAPREKATDQKKDAYRELEIFANVLALAQQFYVDPVEIDELMRGAVNGMLIALDPHSGYLGPEDYQALEEETTGSFTGIGIEVSIKDGVLTTVAPVDGSPADRGGILPGDRIVRIDGAPTKNMPLTEAMKRMRGKKGSKVTLSIERSLWRGARDFVLERDDITLGSVKSADLAPGYAYIRISGFQDATSADLLAALDDLHARGPIRGLVLDLRNNPGGLFDQAVKVADVFLEQGVIVSTRSRNDQEQILYEARPDVRVEDYPMVVLINGGSASGSEIVAGALRDHGRARILGTTSFGKGSVQSVIPLPDGAGIRLTTARYYTPSGDSIQATGIKPDVTLRLAAPPGRETEDDSRQKLLRERDLPGHLDNDTAAPGEREDQEADNLYQEQGFQRVNGIADMRERLAEDNQLRRALELLQGKK